MHSTTRDNRPPCRLPSQVTLFADDKAKLVHIVSEFSTFYCICQQKSIAFYMIWSAAHSFSKAGKSGAPEGWVRGLANTVKNRVIRNCTWRLWKSTYHTLRDKTWFLAVTILLKNGSRTPAGSRCPQRRGEGRHLFSGEWGLRRMSGLICVFSQPPPSPVSVSCAVCDRGGFRGGQPAPPPSLGRRTDAVTHGHVS